MDTGKYFLQLSFESVFQVFLLCPSAYPCLWIKRNPFPRYDGDFFVRNLEGSVEAKVKRGKPARRIRYLHYCTWAHREKRQHSAGGLLWITGFWHLSLFITSSPQTLFSLYLAFFLRFSNFFFRQIKLECFLWPNRKETKFWKFWPDFVNSNLKCPLSKKNNSCMRSMPMCYYTSPRWITTTFFNWFIFFSFKFSCCTNLVFMLLMVLKSCWR